MSTWATQVVRCVRMPGQAGHQLLTLLLLLLCPLIVPAALELQQHQDHVADGEAVAPSLHTVFGAECNTYFDWQSLGVVYSHAKAGVPGPITRLLTCSDHALRSYGANVDLVPTHVAPLWTHNPHNGDNYSAYNKPAAIMHWLEHAVRAICIGSCNSCLLHSVLPGRLVARCSSNEWPALLTPSCRSHEWQSM